MALARAGLALALLAGLGACQTATPEPEVIEVMPDLPPGFPPKIGTATATYDGAARAWDVFDYSIGAIDSAARITTLGGTASFALIGRPPGDPKAKAGRLVLDGGMAGRLSPGALSAPKVEILLGETWDGPRMSSDGQRAQIVIETLRDRDEGGFYGHATGSFRATLCPAPGPLPRMDMTLCRELTGRFDTDLAFDGG